jgi:ribonuclease VapC
LIIDSSALIAILRAEPDEERYTRALAECPASERQISAANYLEAAIVADRASGVLVSRDFDRLVREESITIAPVTETQIHLARAAYRDFGRGSGHPARLNFGDCFAYALAIDRAEPLLFKGDDFSHTDVRSALD